ncbi:MAG: type II secretion system protein GspN [Deltaproteobacteria bacterium]|nr:type II secretion system protein GspN [Deltaproteobacteria bacterium]
MKTGLKYVGYTFYVILVAGVLLYVRFPSETFQSYLVQEAGRMNPPVIFSTRSLDPSFPPGLRLQAPVFSLKERPGTAFFEAQDLSVGPGIGSLILGNTTWFFDARAYGGFINGHIQPGEDGEIDGFSLSLEKVRIHEYAFLPHFGIGDLGGTLNGTIHYKGSPDRIAMGNGTGDIHISEGRINLLNPFLGLETIPFGKLNVRFTLKKGTVHLTSVSFDGKGLQGSISGTIRLNRIMDRSQLNLRGTIEPIEVFLDTLKGGPALLGLFRGGHNGLRRSFVIQGTFRSPKFRFI